MIPSINKKSNVFTKDVLNMVDIMMASTIVAMTSTMAILNTRYECTPSPDFPKIFLYLHNDIYNYRIIKKLELFNYKYYSNNIIHFMTISTSSIINYTEFSS